MIYKLFTGKYIDLSKIITISDAYFIKKMGNGGLFVGFEIECQLLEHKLQYMKVIDAGEYSYGGGGKITIHIAEGGYKDLDEIEDQKEIGVVADLQEEIDEVVEAWKKFKGQGVDRRFFCLSPVGECEVQCLNCKGIDEEA